MKRRAISFRGKIFAATGCAAFALMLAGFCIVREGGADALSPREREHAPSDARESVPATTISDEASSAGTDFSEEAGSRRAGIFGDDDFVFDARSFSVESRADDGNASSAPVLFENGDLYDIYGGGREYRPENSPSENRDNRLWIDARVPLEISRNLRLYGVSTLTLGDVAAGTMEDYARNYGIGGGFGISYKISRDAELNFDFRRTRALENSADKDKDPDTSSAGISVRLKF